MARKGQYGIQITVDGNALPEYEKDGKIYVAAPADRDFKIRILSPSGERTEVVLSVDGLSVMTGKDATSNEGGYVVQGNGQEIPGFRLNNDEVAAFHFGDRRDSYAARLGKPSNVGVIAAKFFSERSLAFSDDELEGCEESPGGAALEGMSPRGARGRDMGTEFGDRTSHRVRDTVFDRDQQEATIRIEYASEASLRQAGIIPRSPLGDVDPFPGDSGCKPPPGWCGTGK